jgi:hypothetical protein
MKLLKILTEESDYRQEFDRDYKEYSELYPYGTPDKPDFEDWRNDRYIEKLIKVAVPKASKIRLKSFVNSFNRKMVADGTIKMLIIDYENDMFNINTFVAFRFLNELAVQIGVSPSDINHTNRSLKATNHFQLVLYSELILKATFVHVDDKHRVVADRTNVQLLDSRSGDNYFETLVSFNQ